MSSGIDVRKMFGNHIDGELFRYAVALGRVTGWQTYRKFGMNDAVGTGGAEDMWPPGTTRVLPTTAGVVSLVSDAATDNVAGTGAWDVVVYGLDADYAEISETITVTGLTPALGVKSFFRINSMSVDTAGSSEWNDGNISASIGGALQAYIEADEGQTHQTMLTVPRGKTLLVNGYNIGIGRMGGSSDGHVKGEIKPPGANKAWRAISDVYMYNGEVYSAAPSNVTAIPEMYEARLQIISSSATQAFGVVSGLLVENKYLNDL